MAGSSTDHKNTVLQSTWPAVVSHYGVSEHVQSGGAPEYFQAIAFANIGLPVDALRGNKWRTQHRPALLKQFSELLADESVIGICLSDLAFASRCL